MNLDPTALIELNGKLERMMDSLDAMKEKQEEMFNDTEVSNNSTSKNGTDDE